MWSSELLGGSLEAAKLASPLQTECGQDNWGRPFQSRRSGASSMEIGRELNLHERDSRTLAAGQSERAAADSLRRAHTFVSLAPAGHFCLVGPPV